MTASGESPPAARAASASRSAAFRRATQADLPALTRVLVQAYMDDPVAMWICGAPSLRAKTLYALYSSRLRQMLEAGEVWTDAQRSSVAVWLAPGRRKPPTAPSAALWRCLLDVRLGARLPLLALGLRRMEGIHPHDPPHWYLSLLGTDPACRGRGLGSAVLQPVLRRCDADGVGVYLESSKERNLGFYGRLGFRVTGELELPRGPKLWPMWREPGAGPATPSDGTLRRL
jgi:ribosomal protein S18 acetylase RimI-like enzyme